MRIIAAAVRAHLRASAETRHRLASSLTKKTKVDLVITLFRAYPPVLAIDVTVSCPMLPSHVAAAAADADTLFATRAAEKNDKHLRGCNDQGRAFLPLVFSSLGGLGPPEALHYLDSIFSELYADERLRTGTVRHTSHLRTLFLQQLLASLTSASADMAQALPADAVADAAANAATDPASADPGPADARGGVSLEEAAGASPRPP